MEKTLLIDRRSCTNTQINEHFDADSHVLLIIDFQIFSGTALLAAGNRWQNGRPTDPPERPRSTVDTAGDCMNSGETPANVSSTACTVQHRPCITTHTQQHNASPRTVLRTYAAECFIPMWCVKTKLVSVSF